MRALIFIFVFIVFNCKAQTIEPIFENSSNKDGVYYKDIDNDFNNFTGTWQYTNGTTSFKIVLIEKEMFLHTVGSKSFYRDFLVGEYQYIENGVEKVNTLSAVSNNYDDILDYNLSYSRMVGDYVYPRCYDCQPGERRIYLSFNEPTRRNVVGLSAGIMLRRITENGVPKIIAIVFNESPSFGFTNDDQPTTIVKYSVPYGEYTLTKIN